ncbi:MULTISPECIES: U32 family peptidase [Blautia]|uniref:U32 family peptidase n=1 Tax=Blautia TaxID=572511 RepID=UPI0011CC6DDB|nr:MULTISPECIES: U32 family peptidase [Blautia]
MNIRRFMNVNTKITSPINEPSELPLLKKAGANEFYLGYIPYEWISTRFNFMPLNGRERMFADFGLCNKKELEQFNSNDKDKIYITINGHYYNNDAYIFLKDYIAQILKIGIKNFIVADFFLIMMLKKWFGPKVNVIVSGDAGVYNSEAVKEFADLGIKRLIFPRKTNINNMEKIVKETIHLQIEYEAFVLNELCYYSGAFCNAFHCDELLRICRLPKVLVSEEKVIKKENFNKRKSNLSSNTDLEQKKIGNTGCGLCKIWKLSKIGINSLKIVGRGKNTKDILMDIKAVDFCLQMVENYKTEQEYIHMVKNEFFPEGCPNDCYYVD